MKVRGKRRHFFLKFAHPLSDNLQVAPLWIELQYLPQVLISASIRQILMTGEMRGMQRRWQKCQSDAAGRLVFVPFFYSFYLGLKFNCVFAVSAVAPVSDGTDVWIAVWHFSLMKIYRPSEPFICSSMFFSSVTHNNNSGGIDRRHQRTSRGELQPRGRIWFIGYHHNNLWNATKVLWHFSDPCTGSSSFACIPHREVWSGSAVAHCLLKLLQIQGESLKHNVFFFPWKTWPVEEREFLGVLGKFGWTCTNASFMPCWQNGNYGKTCCYSELGEVMHYSEVVSLPITGYFYITLKFVTIC